MLKNLTRPAIINFTKRFMTDPLGMRLRKLLLPHEIVEEVVASSEKALAELEGTSQGKSCLILGTAPHVATLPLDQFQVDTYFLLNKAYLLHDRLPRDADINLCMNNRQAFGEYGKDALLKQYRRVFLATSISTESAQLPENTLRFTQWQKPRLQDGLFQTDGTRPLYSGESVLFAVLQIGFWMGFSRIYLGGIDLEVDGAEPHFYQSTTPEAARTLKGFRKNQAAMVEALRYTNTFFRMAGGPRIISLSPRKTLDFLEYETSPTR